MSAGRYDIKKLDRAATFTMKLICKNDDGTLMDLSGYTAKASIKEFYSEDEAIVDFDCSIPLPTNGEIFLTLEPDDTEDLIKCQYYYDVILINGTYIMRLIEGTVHIYPEVTENA